MRSQLTRSVFRRILLNEPLVCRCPRLSSFRCIPLSMLQSPGRRALFGFSRKPPREPREPEIAPGLSKMFDLNNMDKIGARPPPPGELVQAWKKFFSYKQQKNEALNSLQAQHALRTFKYLQHSVEEAGFGLTIYDLKGAFESIKPGPDDTVEPQLELARILFEELNARDPDKGVYVRHFTEILTRTGYSKEARYMATKYWDRASQTIHWRKTAKRLANLVMAGFARENNEAELLKTLEMAEKAGQTYGVASHEILTTFYASRDDISNTKSWYSRPIDGSYLPTSETVSAVLQFSLRNQELDWCKTVFRELLDGNPPKAIWDIIFQWAAGALGKGVEDVERMMEVMIRHNSTDENIRPDVDTINGLVQLAMSSNDPYLAERYIGLGLKHGINPNAQTFLLQLNYRVSAGDLTGAQAAYDALQSEEIINNSDLSAINKYIRALCSFKANHYDQVVSVCSDLDERNVRLEADTVSAVCMMYFSRGELNGVLDTLQANVFHYTLAERSSIINTLAAYCLDRKHTSSESWEAYNIFRHVFQETPIETRTKIMNEFFARKRSDMACHVFGHMRQHVRKEFRPVLDTYIDCFRGIARCSDKESLDMVHNMFKMDSSIEPNTKLYNSLIMAYTECDEGGRALDFWDDVTNSREGPSYESLELVFKACQRQPFGDRTAREVWGKMRRMEIEITRRVFVAYVGALAGQGKLEEAQGVVESAEKDLGLEPDVLTIGTLYNALPGQNRKDLVEGWAKDHFPELWTELEKLGQMTMKEGHRMFNMKNLAES